MLIEIKNEFIFARNTSTDIKSLKTIHLCQKLTLIFCIRCCMRESLGNITIPLYFSVTLTCHRNYLIHFECAFPHIV